MYFPHSLFIVMFVALLIVDAFIQDRKRKKERRESLIRRISMMAAVDVKKI